MSQLTHRSSLAKIRFLLGFLAVVALLSVFRVGSIFFKNFNNQNSTNTSGSVLKANTTNALTIDSDHDGLSDRDEILYGTNPYKPDTDGDTFIDGEEITTGHNPLDSDSNIQTGKGDPQSNKNPNLTDRALNLTVASIIGDDGELDPSRANTQSVNDVVQSIQVQAALSLFVEPLKDSDLNIVSDNSPSAIQQYLSTVLPIIEGNILHPVHSLQSGSNLTGTFDYYRKAFQSLKLVPVPSSWKGVHKNILNLLQIIIKSSESLTDEAINNDPIKASFALKQLSDSFTQFRGILSQASLLAKTQNISTTDPIFELLKN